MRDYTLSELDTLLPCPFCGNSDKLSIVNVGVELGDPEYAVRCSHCFIDGGSFWTRHSAIMWWNTQRQFLGSDCQKDYYPHATSGPSGQSVSSAPESDGSSFIQASKVITDGMPPNETEVASTQGATQTLDSLREVSAGAALIAEERRRQIEGELWLASHDDEHTGGQLALAGALYAIPQTRRRDLVDRLWPWANSWWKPSPEDRIRELEKAGALIAAEIDRLIRSKSDGAPSVIGGNDKQNLPVPVLAEGVHSDALPQAQESTTENTDQLEAVSCGGQNTLTNGNDKQGEALLSKERKGAEFFYPAIKEWAKDDRLWTTQECVERNLRKIVALVLKEPSTPKVAPKTDELEGDTAAEKGQSDAIFKALHETDGPQGEAVHTNDSTAETKAHITDQWSAVLPMQET